MRRLATLLLLALLGLGLCYASAVYGYHFGYAVGYHRGEVKSWFMQAEQLNQLRRDCHPRGDDSIKANLFDGKGEV